MWIVKSLVFIFACIAAAIGIAILSVDYFGYVPIEKNRVWTYREGDIECIGMKGTRVGTCTRISHHD